MSVKVSHEQLASLIRVCYAKKKPLFIIGGVGIGKSDTVREAAQRIAEEKGLCYAEDGCSDESKFALVDIRISQLYPSDLRGLPVFDAESKATRWYPPSWLPSEGSGIIFFDEINLAPPSIQASAYQLILDRKLGDYKLPEGYIIVAAGNRLEDKANVFELPAPLSNRFVHCELSAPSVEDWTKWALRNGIDARIIAFLSYRKSYLYRFDGKSSDRAFPTPRSWHYCSELIKGEPSLENIELLSAAAVGEATAIEFTAFLKLREKIDLQAFLNNPHTAALPEQVDLKYALSLALAEHYKEKPSVLPKILVLCERLEPELACLLLRACKLSNEGFVSQLLNENKQQWSKLSEKYAKYFL